MKILVVLHAGLVANNPRARRWQAVTEHLAALGHDLTVVQAGNGRSAVAPSESGRVEVREVRDLASGFVDGGAGQRRTEPGNPVPRGAGLRQLVKRALRAVAAFLRWPDSAFLWVVPASVTCMRLEKERRFDAMISVSHPFSCHLVGLMLKARSPRLRWIMDCGDPFAFMTVTQPNNFALYGRLNRWAERKCLEMADSVSVTCDGTRRMYEEAFPISSGKTTVIGPLYRPEHSVPYAFSPTDDERPTVRVVFAGSLYASIRKPSGSIEFFRQVAKLLPTQSWELHFVGQSSGSNGLPANGRIEDLDFFFHEFRSVGAARGMLETADCLLSISNDTWYQLPSKLVDYMATGKPIVNLSRIKDDESSAFLRQYSAGLTVVFDGHLEQEDQQRVHNFFVDLRCAPREERERVCRAYSIESIGALYAALLAVQDHAQDIGETNRHES